MSRVVREEALIGTLRAVAESVGGPNGVELRRLARELEDEGHDRERHGGGREELDPGRPSAEWQLRVWLRTGDCVDLLNTEGFTEETLAGRAVEIVSGERGDVVEGTHVGGFRCAIPVRCVSWVEVVDRVVLRRKAEEESGDA